MESWKIFFKYFFLLFKKLLCKIMEYGVSRMEFVKTQYVIQMSEHISVFIAFFTRIYFLKVIFLLYILICSVTCFFCSIAFRLLSSSVLLCHTLMCSLPNTSYYNGFLSMETQLNVKLQMNYLQEDNWAQLLKSWPVINSSKFCGCDNSMPKI